MPIPADQMTKATALLLKREDAVPVEVRDMLKLCHRTEGNSIMLFEFRPRFMRPGEWQEQHVAKFKYVQSRNCWQLFWMNRHLKWVRYEELPEAATFQELFEEVNADPLCIFWG